MSRHAANLLTLAFLAATVAFAPGHVAEARTSDRNQPMDLSADQYAGGVNEGDAHVYTGNVEIVQGSLNIRAARAEVFLRNDNPDRVTLTGTPVVMSQELDDGSPMTARASTIHYTLNNDTIVLTGNAQIEQPRGNMSGERIVYNTATGRIEGGGEGGGRVQMRIQPRPQDGSN